MNIHTFASILNAPRAYIDPSTGGMLFQILAVIFAALSGILFFFSRQIRAFFGRFRRMTGEEQNDDESQSAEEQQNPPE